MTHPIMQGSPWRAPFLLVGEAPGHEIPRHLWLLPDDSGIPHSANRLRDHLGLTTAWYEAYFDRTNLLMSSQARTSAGRSFNLEAARHAAMDLYLAAAGRYRGVLVLGKRAARAFRWRDETHAVQVTQVRVLRWYQVLPMGSAGRCGGGAQAGLRAAIIPHPSGVNRWWNDPENARRARRWFVDQLRVSGISGTHRREGGEAK